MTRVCNDLVSRIRASSRQLVRELGFMSQTLAGTNLPPSAVHALIELGETQGLTARELGNRLLLEKSTVSRMLKGLKAQGLVNDVRSDQDGRAKRLSLTHQGRQTLANIIAYAEPQVESALLNLEPGQAEQVADALSAYANALARGRTGKTTCNGRKAVEVRAGYAPGLIGAIAGLHGSYYAREAGFTSLFEARVAEGLSEFVPRLASQTNQVWYVWHTGSIQGSIAIDGEDLGAGVAHLRWFIVSDQVRGTGMGRALLEHALNFCDQHGFAETHLWTFRGLDDARRLYEANGFGLTEEYWGDQWGTKVKEQRFVRSLH